MIFHQVDLADFESAEIEDILNLFNLNGIDEWVLEHQDEIKEITGVAFLPSKPGKRPNNRLSIMFTRTDGRKGNWWYEVTMKDESHCWTYVGVTWAK